MLLGGDFFLGAILAAALTKLVLRLRQLSSPRLLPQQVHCPGTNSIQWRVGACV